MTWRRTMAFLAEYGGLIGGLGGFAGFLASLVYAFGFTVGTPATAVAQLNDRVTALESDRGGTVGLQRYLCYRDPKVAPLFIPCDRLNGNNLPRAPR